ncbi:uncharacterized protein LOC143637529 [Bidens hawaiensis]|uniref:uncharacterized protein LOC143637529 n=1 Tax=Bidens hawaiensis TaxID=980011 RepID=UPI00404A99EB
MMEVDTSSRANNIMMMEVETASLRTSNIMMVEVDTTSSRANNIMVREINTGSSRPNEKRPLEISSLEREARKNPENNGSNNTIFINHGAIAWNESRRKWVGEQSQRSRKERTPEDPIISWSTTYEDLLSNNDHFPEPIPLPEMVDFLVDVWLDEGLYD